MKTSEMTADERTAWASKIARSLIDSAMDKIPDEECRMHEIVPTILGILESYPLTEQELKYLGREIRKGHVCPYDIILGRVLEIVEESDEHDYNDELELLLRDVLSSPFKWRKRLSDGAVEFIYDAVTEKLNRDDWYCPGSNDSWETEKSAWYFPANENDRLGLHERHLRDFYGRH
jgi:hypothetical protein